MYLYLRNQSLSQYFNNIFPPGTDIECAYISSSRGSNSSWYKVIPGPHMVAHTTHLTGPQGLKHPVAEVNGLMVASIAGILMNLGTTPPTSWPTTAAAETAVTTR
jgi:hypothetical protein